MTSAAAHSKTFEIRKRNQPIQNVEDQRLADIIFDNSFGRGNIILASGKRSDFYFDMKPSMLHPEGSYLIAKKILEEALKVDAQYIGGLDMGAVPITGAVSALSHEQHRPVHGFFVRKAVKNHGVKKLIEGIAPSDSIQGKRVVIVDDVTTTGDSALKAVDACREAGANIVLVISIVDRQEGAIDAFRERGIAFKYLFGADEFLSREPTAR
jgi:orotate phosphoribosyltransferase